MAAAPVLTQAEPRAAMCVNGVTQLSETWTIDGQILVGGPHHVQHDGDPPVAIGAVHHLFTCQH